MTALLAAAMFATTIDVQRPSVVVATIRAGCARCDWSAAGREAVVLKLSIDGGYSQHLVLARGESPADYAVSFGRLTSGRHLLVIERDAELSAPDAGPESIAVPDVRQLMEGAGDPSTGDFTALSMAPVLYARANTVGRFTDVPLLMWYEVVPTSRGRQYRYSVIFTNEDGGTPADRLMATWGRTTDIEYVYGVELDDRGQVVAEEIQGAGHELPPFTGRHEGRRPLLWVVTDNNMVGERGTTTIRYAPAAERVDLRNASREVVMDAHPWTYGVMTAELAREGKIAADPAAGTGRIPDPRRFVYIEACGDVGKGSVSFEIAGVSSDRGQPRFRIARDGCIRAAVPMPPASNLADIRDVRVVAHDLPVRLSRINKVFMLDDRFVPGPSILEWSGTTTIDPSQPLVLPVR